MAATSEKKIGMLAFMPWVTIKEPTTFDKWELIPVQLKELNESEKEIKRILSCYKVHVNCPIRSATLLKNKNKGLLDSLDEDERAEYFLLGEIIGFASLACREFFSWRYYSNSDSQQLILQSFVEGSKGFSVVSRRRDGSTTNFSPDEYYVIIQDSHVKNGDLELNVELATALLKSQETDAWASIHESIFCYLKANTDDNNVHLQAELMFSMGAFERLLEVNNGQCSESARKFVALIASALSEEAKPDNCQRNFGKLNQSSSIREIWMRDFCACRGDMAHGRIRQSYPSIWTPNEHLLLSSEIFPIALKIKLSSLGLYSLTDDDLKRIFYFDRRLRTSSLYQIGENRGEPIFGWEDARRKAVWEWEFTKESLMPKN